MTCLEQVLLGYAQENLVPTYLTGIEYRRSTAAIEQQKAALRQQFPEDCQQLLEDYLTERMILEGMEQEAHFWAGLRLGMQLSRV